MGVEVINSSDAQVVRIKSRSGDSGEFPESLQQRILPSPNISSLDPAFPCSPLLNSSYFLREARPRCPRSIFSIRVPLMTFVMEAIFEAKLHLSD